MVQKGIIIEKKGEKKMKQGILENSKRSWRYLR
jgi:hypothetical protein